MTVSGTPLVRPPTEGGRPDGPAPDRPQERSWARRHPGRVRIVAFAVSAVVHLLVLFLYPEITVRFGEVDSVAESGETSAEGMEVINLQETASDDPDAPIAPEETVAPDAPVSVPLSEGPAERFDPAPPSRPGDGLTAADRLRPATREEGLWIPLIPEAVTLTDEEILQSLIYGQLQAFNDSMAIRAAQAARGTDWTYTDDEGNRWGISPGRLHLGRFSIPLPFGFGASPGANDDALDALAMDAEIRRMAGQLDADATVEERAAAIRARIDAERERRSAQRDTSRGGGGGGR